jgi:excisionase family DNA binding protein
MTEKVIAPVGERLLTVDDAAKACNVSDKTIRRWIRDGHLVCTLVGPALRIRIASSELIRIFHANAAQ